MMPWIVNVTATAEDDLTRAVDYIANVLQNRRAALSLVDEFEKCVERLASMPESRPVVLHELLARKGYRWIPVGNYLVFYTLNSEVHMVNVERFLYGRSDCLAVL